MAPQSARFPAGLADRSPDHRHTGASDRRHGGGVSKLRPQGRRQAPQGQIHPLAFYLSVGAFMIRNSCRSRRVDLRRARNRTTASRCSRQAECDRHRHHQGRIVIQAEDGYRTPARRAYQAAGAEGYYNNVPFHRVMDGFMAQTATARISMAPAARNIRPQAGVFQGSFHARRCRHGTARRQRRLRQFAVLHHVRRGNSPRWPVHRDREVVQAWMWSIN